MVPNESAAHELVVQLIAAGIAARVTGGGVHWQVDAGPAASRTMRVHCFWYERASSGLFLGMNPSNARSRLHGARLPYEGPEYLVILHDGGVLVADGRSHKAAEAVACARAWLAGNGIDRLVRELPFVDEKRRAMKLVAERLDGRLRWEIGTDPAYELWVYGDGRSCCVASGDDTMTCRFRLGPAQVAMGAALSDVPAAIATWLIDRVPVRTLATEIGGIELERYAEVLETDPAEWHWSHLRDRIADPDDVLAPLRDLILALAASPVAAAFYSYSSLFHLCFSASSHYPWVDHGLPKVISTGDGAYLVGDMRCNLDRAVELIEATLATSPIRPFFGSAPQHELPILAEGMARQGSVLRPQLEQHGGWYELVVADAMRARQCRVTNRSVAFMEAAGQLYATWPTLDDAVSAICRYCEEGATLDEIAADPRAQHVMKPK